MASVEGLAFGAILAGGNKHGRSEHSVVVCGELQPGLQRERCS